METESLESLAPERESTVRRMQQYELLQWAITYAGACSRNSAPAAERLMRERFNLELDPSDLDIERRHLAQEAAREIRRLQRAIASGEKRVRVKA